MKTKNYLFLFFAVFSVIIFITGEITFAQTLVSGNISSNTTWAKAGNPYVVDADVVVLEGVTLTIQPGVIVKFKDYYMDMWVSGTLKAIGSSSEKIIFTSYKDDAHGGDTNGDGGASSPAADDWGGIVLGNSSSGNQFKYCWFAYGGGWATSAVLEVRISEAEIRNSTFTNSLGRGLYSEKSSLDILDCNFSNNSTEGIYFNGLHETKESILTNNSFQNNTNWAVVGKLFNCKSNIILSGNSSTGSSHNGFGIFHWVDGIVVFTGQTDFPFIVTNDDVVVAENASLTFSEGTTIKFDTYYSDIWVHGTLLANASAEEQITFTSIKDDAHGGDTNGDANATEPANDDWGGIVLENTSTGNSFNNCWFGYGGGWATSALLEIKNSEVQIRNSHFCYSLDYGVYSQAAALDIQNSYFIENSKHGLVFNGLSATEPSVLLNNQFTGNKEWAVLGKLGSCETNITLSGNSSSGSAQNGFGIYDIVSGNVVFDGQLDFPFIVEGSDVIVAESASLTFTPGTGIKFQSYYSDLWVYGTLTAIGTPSEIIYFTSLKDDDHGGDSNSDAGTTTPAGDDWGGVIFNDSSVGNKLKHCWIGYGGGWASEGNIMNLSSEVEIRNSTIAYAYGRGLESRYSVLDVQNTIFLENSTDGIYYDGLDENVNSVLSYNQFTDNGNWSVFGILRNCQTDILLTGNTGTGSLFSGFGMYGNITGDVLFDGQTNFPFIVGGSDVVIDESATLTFSEGTTVKFESYYSDLWVNGALVAKGTSADPISFTSIKDDIHGGDTNSDGSSTNHVMANDWGGIIYGTTSTDNVLEHCWIGYGGGWSTNANVQIFNNGFDVKNCTFAFSSEIGVFTQNAALSFYNCIFDGNTSTGLYYNGLRMNEPNVLQNNQFIDNFLWSVNGDMKETVSDITLSGNTSSGSNRNGFGVKGHIIGGNNVTFTGQTQFPFIVTPALTVTGKLTISPGTNVKFHDYYSDIFVYGTLDAQGTSSDPIVFTSIKDDMHGGDTNGDEAATEASPDDWGVLYFYDVSTNSKLINTWIGYGGGWSSSAMVTTFSTGLEIDFSTITKSSDWGIYIDGGNPKINHSVISNNVNGIYTRAGSLPTIKYNEIKDNTTWGIYNEDVSVDVDALNNWWGDASGPFHASLNAGGQGNKVSDHVLFDPWNLTTSANELGLSNKLVLGQHYPNPVLGAVTIPFELGESGRVLLQVVNIDGKIVKTLLNENRQVGKYQLQFNSLEFKSGTYFLRLTSNNVQKVSRLIVVN